MNWRERPTTMTLETLQASLPIIPVYQGEEKKDRKSKIFDYPCLEVREPMMLKTYSAPMSLWEVTQVVDGLLSPRPYHPTRESIWPETRWEDHEEGESLPSAEEIVSCADVSFEDYLVTRDLVEKLLKKVTPEEQFVFEGLASGRSKRELADLAGCSPGTIETRRLQIEAKAASLDPVVATISARYLRHPKP